MNIYSFDVFDTLLIRSCDSPEAVFDIWARRVLGPEASLQKVFDLAYLRRCVPAKAAAEFGTYNLTIEQIYALADFTPFTSLPNEKMMQLEMQTEAYILKGVQSMRQHIQSLRKEGNEIIFVSDMYLPSSFISSILKREGFMEEADRIWVSCEHQADKRSGSLWTQVLSSNWPKGSKLIHTGDNPISDNKSLKRAFNQYQKSKLTGGVLQNAILI